MLFVKVTLYSVDVYGRETLSYEGLPVFLQGKFQKAKLLNLLLLLFFLPHFPSSLLLSTTSDDLIVATGY